MADAFAAATLKPDLFPNASAYERLMGRWSERLAPLFLDFAHVQVSGRILDVGCGTGALAQELARRNSAATIVGIDPSKPFIDYARQRFQGSRCTFDYGDGMALPYPDASFDCSLSLLVFMFIPQPETAAGEMRRVTRPGGTVSACVWDSGGGGMEMARIFWEEAVKLDPAAATLPERNVHCNRAGELTRVWHAAGLEHVEEVPLQIRTEFSSFDDYWLPYNSGVGPQGVYTNKLSATQREALRERLRTRLLGEHPDGTISLRAGAWAVRGTVPT
jgi:SAM-dependent methyltransferase